MKKFAVVLFLALVGVSAFAAPRHRAVMQPVTRLDILVPAQIGLSYGHDNSQKYILTAKADGTLWEQVYAPYALGNTMPSLVLDASSAPAELVLRSNNGVVGIRFYPQNDAVYSGAILPFNPFNSASAVVDAFTPRTKVDGLLMDCPIQGIPNTSELTSIVAYNHIQHYIVVMGRYYLMSTESVSPLGTTPVDGPDGYPMVLLDHYQDANGAWYVLASQCLRDAQGNIITSNPAQRKCPEFQ